MYLAIIMLQGCAGYEMTYNNEASSASLVMIFS